MPRGEFKHRYCPVPTLQISPGIIALFQKIYHSEPILTVVSNIGEDVQYCCFNPVYDVKSVSLPETKPILENYYRLQIIEKGVAEQFLGLSQNEASPNLYIREISLKRELSNDITIIQPLFSLVTLPLSLREKREAAGHNTVRWPWGLKVG